MHRARLRHGRGSGGGRGVGDRHEAARRGQAGQVRRAPCGRAHARAAQRAAGRGRRAVRHGLRDGGDQRGDGRDRRRHGHWRQRHCQLRCRGRPQVGHRWHARHPGLEVQARHLHEAFHGLGLRRCGQPGVLQDQHGYAPRRRQEDLRRHPQ